MLSILFFLFIASIMSSDARAAQVQVPADRSIQSHIQQEVSRYDTLLQELYRLRGYRPLWDNPEDVRTLLSLVHSVENDGLDPDEYQPWRLQACLDEPPASLLLQAGCELMMTEALVRVVWHLTHGRVNPEDLDPHWNIPYGEERDLFVKRLTDAAEDERLFQVVDSMRPAHRKYLDLKQALYRYRSYEADGGWEPVPAGPVLSLMGSSDSRIPLLRRRLAITGDLPPGTPVIAGPGEDPDIFSSQLVEGVRHFQRRHGLVVDGAVGPETLRELNVPASARTQQILINLERYRWFIGKLEPSFLFVNIAGFTLHYVEDNSFRWRTRVIVGKPYWKTPVFRSLLTHVVFNPSWEVPPGIIKKEALPALRAGRDYAGENGLEVIDRENRRVDPASVDWKRYGSGGIPFRLRQPPGAGNALGRVKFVFPNRHLVYLHDTPGKYLFDRTERAFSHGCIRVEHPLELATLVLGSTIEEVDSYVASGKTRQVRLKEPLPVFLLYLTAVAEGDQVYFRRDIYNRDAALARVLQPPHAP